LSKKILVIPDTQCKPGVDLSYMNAIGHYIVDKQPDVVVHIGDFADMESLSSYDKGKKSFEGRRLKADIEASNEAMAQLMAPLNTYNEAQKRAKKKLYTPRLVLTMGNHEERLDRLANDMPELDGFVGTDLLNFDKWGWEVHPYLQPVVIEGVAFVHYLANPFSGRPYGGSAMSQLKTVGQSFVVGHKQTLDIAMRPVLNGDSQIGIIAGACYPFDEAYKGAQGNHHFRGVVMLHEVENGSALPMIVSLKYLMGRYNK
jgi:Calcineurin-like phosphoesterase